MRARPSSGKQIIDTSTLPAKAKKLLQKRGKLVEKHKLVIDPTKIVVRVYQRYYHPKFGYLYELLSKEVKEINKERRLIK